MRTVSVRFNHSELQTLNTQARQENKSQSAYIRDRLLKLSELESCEKNDLHKIIYQALQRVEGLENKMNFISDNIKSLESMNSFIIQTYITTLQHFMQGSSAEEQKSIKERIKSDALRILSHVKNDLRGK